MQRRWSQVVPTFEWAGSSQIINRKPNESGLFIAGDRICTSNVNAQMCSSNVPVVCVALDRSSLSRMSDTVLTNNFPSFQSSVCLNTIQDTGEDLNQGDYDEECQDAQEPKVLKWEPKVKAWPKSLKFLVKQKQLICNATRHCAKI